MNHLFVFMLRNDYFYDGKVDIISLS